MKSASGTPPAPSRAVPAPVDPAKGDFVINLCSSTTPMALAKPQDPALARFSFFVSRRREDGRERFRLHMGYFPTMAAAEEWLLIVREVYPGAWAGDAPGRKLAARGQPSAAAPQPVAPKVAAPVAKAPPPRAPVPATQVAPAPDDATVIQRAPRQPQAPVVSPSSAKPPMQPSAPQVVAPKARPKLPPVVPVLSPEAATAKAAVVAAATQGKAAKTPPGPESNIREVLAELDELSDTQTLRVLEGRNPTTKSGSTATYDEAIPLVRPDDTLTMRAIKADVQRQAPVSFAVQLEWSVTPIETSKVPPLAIFSAYTLYTTEANRQGRRWYGLRLGFFSDAISAKQVAYYVRSDFGAVAVVPVSSDEKENATRPKADSSVVPQVAATEIERVEGDIFRLLDDDTPPPIELDVVGETSPRAARKPVPDLVVNKASVKAAVEAARPSGRKSERKGGRLARQSAKSKSSASRLDETLEILGADQLDFDKGRGELISDSGVRHLRMHVDQRGSKFTSLLDRIAQKLGRS
ncbi:MAG TPA: hypothetical protein P5528_08175 [Steroidobacteraceae bacterium]|nr:hypothetical protein [Steroidobacteraceae bacterium]HRX89410.1 hypothetical protein [Steroidobacteraceae bacterium]